MSLEDSIGQISFDKTGEGLPEDLYRQSIVALNLRLKNDDSVSVSADAKNTLNQWVNGMIYRAAVSATKNLIASLGLQSFLNDVATER